MGKSTCDNGDLEGDLEDDLEREIGALLVSPPDPREILDRVALQRSREVAVVTLSHPQAQNALNLASWRRLRQLFEDLAGEPKLKAVILRGAGDKAFAAGADIKEFPHTRMTAADATDYNESLAACLRAVAAAPIPVIAAVRGLAVGGGCELVTACDVAIAADDARFGIPLGKLGVILGFPEAEAVARRIGPAALKYLLFSGELVGADDALRWGMVQKVVSAGELADATARLVGQICRQSAVTMRAAKMIAGMHGRTLTGADTDALIRLAIAAYDGDDLREGVAAFTEGRPPRFDGGSAI
ncbi:enoyl-CoA hydratase/isomerase family protein [Mycobacterium spongiae]|uniref:Enoyl-CoA hydratase/isomerase family protein n=1 Tax=Mycobacterium spongiae TaxID=886343 RepID=A0A975JXY5_9MYCO|nr:enoyl-CoA hydratase-related protein [Mycobacterium spongiae]QUR67755.1 enoyl-CoA hydratase/isomerase family protein [Mycobacterium spongiae]